MRSGHVALSVEQKRLLCVVAEAINKGVDMHQAVDDEFGASVIKAEVNSVIRILRLIGFQRGQEPGSAVARLYDALNAASSSEEWEPPPYVDDRV